MSSPILQFAPFSSTLDNGFWHQLTKKKIDVYRLDETPVEIQGSYTYGGVKGLPPLVNIDYAAFDLTTSNPPHHFSITGQLHITNTLENFKVVDKQALLNDAGHKIWKDISSCKAIEDPQCLSKMICLTFADLKKYIYTYWFAFPALCLPKETTLTEDPIPIKTFFNEKQISELQSSYDKLDQKDKGYFSVIIGDQCLECKALSEFPKQHNKKILIGFSDPSNLNQHPGWPLRNLLALIAFHWLSMKQEWEVLCFRDQYKDGERTCSSSIVLKVLLKVSEPIDQVPAIVGWEKNKNKLMPRKANLSTSLDPQKLAESAVNLNLKLMKWRLVPEIDLESISSLKCLLFGAGTLGCNVARCLLGWGVKNISFVDNGKISYSNPVRQSLFNFEDCLDEGKPKASAAAMALKKIVPNINAEGYVLSIPMPGHSIPEALEIQTKSDVQEIEKLIIEHDVIFLLTDTRESRWLPTVIGAANQKIVINSALGFDTFMVVRHGYKAGEQEVKRPMKDIIPGNELGCYFCNDVVAPGDSTRDRTLDQQCTVTRPGVSMIAAALAVEMLMSLIQHPLGPLAPADATSSDTLLTETESPLGIVPHQIRGFMSRFYHILPATTAFSNCAACSKHILDPYKANGFDFLKRVFDEPGFLEDISGLKQLQDETDLAEVWELSDSE